MTRLTLVAALILIAGCASTPAPHPRLFCVPAVATGGGRVVEGILCEPVPPEVQSRDTEVRPARTQRDTI